MPTVSICAEICYSDDVISLLSNTAIPKKVVYKSAVVLLKALSPYAIYAPFPLSRVDAPLMPAAARISFCIHSGTIWNFTLTILHQTIA